MGTDDQSFLFGISGLHFRDLVFHLPSTSTWHRHTKSKPVDIGAIHSQFVYGSSLGVALGLGSRKAGQTARAKSDRVARRGSLRGPAMVGKSYGK